MNEESIELEEILSENKQAKREKKIRKQTLLGKQSKKKKKENKYPEINKKLSSTKINKSLFEDFKLLRKKWKISFFM
jgi:hypothetical protein